MSNQESSSAAPFVTPGDIDASNDEEGSNLDPPSSNSSASAVYPGQLPLRPGDIGLSLTQEQATSFYLRQRAARQRHALAAQAQAQGQVQAQNQYPTQLRPSLFPRRTYGVSIANEESGDDDGSEDSDNVDHNVPINNASESLATSRFSSQPPPFDTVNTASGVARQARPAGNQQQCSRVADQTQARLHSPNNLRQSNAGLQYHGARAQLLSAGSTINEIPVQSQPQSISYSGLEDHQGQIRGMGPQGANFRNSSNIGYHPNLSAPVPPDEDSQTQNIQSAASSLDAMDRPHTYSRDLAPALTFVPQIPARTQVSLEDISVPSQPAAQIKVHSKTKWLLQQPTDMQTVHGDAQGQSALQQPLVTVRAAPMEDSRRTEDQVGRDDHSYPSPALINFLEIVKVNLEAGRGFVAPTAAWHELKAGMWPGDKQILAHHRRASRTTAASVGLPQLTHSANPTTHDQSDLHYPLPDYKPVNFTPGLASTAQNDSSQGVERYNPHSAINESRPAVAPQAQVVPHDQSQTARTLSPQADGSSQGVAAPNPHQWASSMLQGPRTGSYDSVAGYSDAERLGNPAPPASSVHEDDAGEDEDIGDASDEYESDEHEEDPLNQTLGPTPQISPQEAAHNEAKYGPSVEAAEQDRQQISEADIAAQGIEMTIDESHNKEEDQTDRGLVMLGRASAQTTDHTERRCITYLLRKDFLRRLSNFPEIIFELATQLPIKSFIDLYSISKDFHQLVNGHMRHCMLRTAELQAPLASKVFNPRFYAPLLVPDPVGRLFTKSIHPGNIIYPQAAPATVTRKVPGLRWLQMVNHREKAVRIILACLARQGHRLPAGTAKSLQKMWLLMDIATTARRAQFLKNRNYFTDHDLYNWQMFFVKLDMRFNHPIDGPGDDGLRQLMLGQRGLSVLCRTLQRKTCRDSTEALILLIKYSYKPRPQHRCMPILGVKPKIIGKGHLEGWGKGRVHLARPDELCVREASRRQLGLKDHILEMMIWGWVNPRTGEDIETPVEEMYISEEEGMPLDDDQGTMGRKEKEAAKAKKAHLMELIMEKKMNDNEKTTESTGTDTEHIDRRQSPSTEGVGLGISI